MTKHVFTHADCQKGGWQKCRIEAKKRQSHPSEHERQVIHAMHEMGVSEWKREYEFWNEIAGFPQFFDFYWPEQQLALEADGSNDYHNVSYATKMVKYDVAKIEYCAAHHIRLAKVGKEQVQFLRDILDKAKVPELQEISAILENIQAQTIDF
jgi:hypothetical protein